MGKAMILHATAVALTPPGGGTSRAALITGASGRGKSTLGLQLMAFGAELVADDRVRVWRAGDAVLLGCPPALRGMIEARGVGLLRANGPATAALCVVVDLDRTESARLPALHLRDMLGISVPVLHKSDMGCFPAAILQYLRSGRKMP